MDIMVSGIVARDVLNRIPGKCISTVVVYGLDRREAEEGHALTGCETGDFVGDACTEGVEEEAFERVVVEGSVCVGDVEAVVSGVELCWFGLVNDCKTENLG